MERRRYGLWSACAGLIALAIVGTFGDFSSQPPAPSPRAGSLAPVSAGAGRRAARPIPEVIAKPRRFRLGDATAAAELPQPTKNAAIRVVATDDMPVTQPLAFPAAPFVATPGRRQEARAAGRPEVAEIRDMMRGYLTAFNRHDTAALASHWSDSGESVDLDSGDVTKGRDAVAGVFASLFERDADASIDIDIESIKPVRPDVAIVDGVSLLSFNDATQAGSRFSAVVVRERGQWVLSSVRESAVPAPTTARRPLEQLDWLVGSWEDIGDDMAATTHCSWNTSRSFLTRSHVTIKDTDRGPADGIPALLPTDARHREISEIIGWDPDLRQIRSWVFTSDGRFAEGFWNREGDGWQVRYEGRGSDAGAACSFTIERPGPDEVVTRCSPSPLADMLPPATDFVRTAYLGQE